MSTPSADARRILLQEHVALSRQNLVFSIPTILILAGVMTNFVSIWSAVAASALVIANSTVLLLVLKRTAPLNPSGVAEIERVQSLLVAFAISGGLVWGLAFLFLLPTSTEGQLLLAVAGPAVMLLNLIETAPIRAAFLSFHIGFATLGACAYLLLADGAARWIALMVILLAVHAVPVANTVRTNAIKRAELEVGRGCLIEELSAVNAELEVRTRHDGLTGLLNRASLVDEMREMTTPAQVLFTDLDGFKQINDDFGHNVGDGVIVLVAQRIKAVMPADALACRIGGDEFVIVLPEAPTLAAERLAETLIAAVAEPLPNPRGERISASVGIAPYRPGDDRPSEAVSWADAAMYRAKSTGPGHWSSVERPLVDDSVGPSGLPVVAPDSSAVVNS